jgi:hypothetical protein
MGQFRGQIPANVVTPALELGHPEQVYSGQINRKEPSAVAIQRA